MTVKTAIVTGANAGIGFEITRALAGQGYKTIMACRNQLKAQEAKQSLLDEQPNANLVVLPLDLSELSSVNRFVELFASEVGELDLLINNAGLMSPTLVRNSEGHELQLATNYLGNFALIGKLLPYFCETRPCRIVNVGSLSHRFGKLALDDFNCEKMAYTEIKGYAHSKIALLTYTIELNRRLAHSGKNLIALAAHPGFANTNITRKEAVVRKKSSLRQWFQNLLEPFIPVARDAARSILLAACDPKVQGGDYYGPGGFMEMGGKPAKAKLNRVALDPDMGRQLWALSEAMTGVRYLSLTE